MAKRGHARWAATWLAATLLTAGVVHNAAGATVAYLVWTVEAGAARHTAVHIMNVETAETRVLVEFEHAGGLHASADGRRLVCVTGRGLHHRLTLIDARTGAVEYLPREDDISAYWAPKFSLRGDRLLYAYSKPSGAPSALKVLDLRTRVSTWLTKRGYLAMWPDWSPDGTEIVFVKKDPRLPSYDLHVMPAEGGAARDLTFWHEQDDEPAWSPDGREIAFVRVGQFGGPRASVYDVESGDVRELTEITSQAFRPSWSPDSRQIVFHGGAVTDLNRGRDTLNIYAIGRDGSDLRRLTHHEPDMAVNPVWVDADLLAVSRAGKVVTTWGRVKRSVSEKNVR